MTHAQYAPFNSAVDPGFWHKLTEKKLNEYGLDDSQRLIHGFFSNGNAPGMSPQFTVDFSAFNSQFSLPPHNFPAHGLLYNTNTIESFKEKDKICLLSTAGEQMWDDIRNGVFLTEPQKLSRFILLTFADLKKYHFYYWFAFPALKYPEKSTFTETPAALEKIFSSPKLSSLVSAYHTFQTSRPNYAMCFLIQEDGEQFNFLEFDNLDKSLTLQQNVIVGICDPSSLDNYPGWPVRNLITFLTYRFTGVLKSIKVLCVRDRTHDGVRDFGKSILMTLDILEVDKSLTEVPECVGWEKNERQKLGPRMVNLSSSMDPVRLAESAVDLNLRLMRWRLLPDLQLEKIASTSCLILGSGTLGCNVARLLMSWGIRHITMVDNSKVSFSNPVRQTLFTFEHCLQGGKPKAQAASETLKSIFPGMKSEGLTLSIPMPGHAITESLIEQTRAEVKSLEELIENHDAVFLLMDTRESRWLPSLICASKKKIVINAALGFDTFLVLRHGVKTGKVEISHQSTILDKLPGSLLGCYFCNDVVAPGNSTRDRTLDQQCTVTRPGVSMMASALAVELLVSILQHPLGSDAPAEVHVNDSSLLADSDCSLGIVPHQIRGFLSRYQQILPATQAFNMCTACCPKVIEAYEAEGFNFLLRAFNEPGYLEDLTGLSAMQSATQDSEVWDLSDDEEPQSMEANS
ncbi:Autophagy protein 7 [Bulinus truncatus]|nr:Autophagy protein 7 [Bulinus truncatus]